MLTKLFLRHDPRIIMVVIVLPSKVELRVLAQRDRLGPGVGGGDPAATPAAPAADGRTSRQQDAAAEALTEMFGKIKFQLDLDPRLAEAAALRLANEMMGISARGTLTEQAKLLLDEMGLASSQHSPGPKRAARGRSTTPRARVLPASSHRTPGPECAAPGRSTTRGSASTPPPSAAGYTPTRCDAVVVWVGGGWRLEGGG